MMLSPEKLKPLSNLDCYRILFSDAEFWSPFVHEVCNRHKLYPLSPVTCRVPGTYPTFIVAERWVVKFFGELFEGEACFKVEQTCAQLLSDHPVLPCPELLASGFLVNQPGSWSWPYLVFEYLPGVSIGEVYTQVGEKDWLRIANQMGEWVKQLHSLPSPAGEMFSEAKDTYQVFLKKQSASCVANHRQWGSLPMKWIEQIPEYLLPIEMFYYKQPPHLIHADLTADHLLVQEGSAGWEILGIIDFGDAMIGSLDYELVALQLDLFHGNRQLLKAFLDAYGLNESAQRELPHRAMTAALLHQFDVFVNWQVRLPHMAHAASLEDFADRAWGINF